MRWASAQCTGAQGWDAGRVRPHERPVAIGRVAPPATHETTGSRGSSAHAASRRPDATNAWRRARRGSPAAPHASHASHASHAPAPGAHAPRAHALACADLHDDVHLAHLRVLIRLEDLADVGVVERALDLNLPLEILERPADRVQPDHLHRIQLANVAPLHGDDAAAGAATKHSAGLSLVHRLELLRDVPASVVVHKCVRKRRPVGEHVGQVARGCHALRLAASWLVHALGLGLLELRDVDIDVDARIILRWRTRRRRRGRAPHLCGLPRREQHSTRSLIQENRVARAKRRHARKSKTRDNPLLTAAAGAGRNTSSSGESPTMVHRISYKTMSRPPTFSRSPVDLLLRSPTRRDCSRVVRPCAQW